MVLPTSPGRMATSGRRTRSSAGGDALRRGTEGDVAGVDSGATEDRHVVGCSGRIASDPEGDPVESGTRADAGSASVVMLELVCLPASLFAVSEPLFSSKFSPESLVESRKSDASVSNCFAPTLEKVGLRRCSRRREIS